MSHPEIKVSWVSLFLKAFGTLIHAENADFSSQSAFICVQIKFGGNPVFAHPLFSMQLVVTGFAVIVHTIGEYFVRLPLVKPCLYFGV
jgi:hypothetical protein